MIGPQIAIAMVPPPFQQSKDEINRSLPVNTFRHYQQSTRRQKLAHVPDCLANVAGSMQHVSGHDKIVVMIYNSLRGWRLFDVKDRITYERIRAKLASSVKKEQLRDVG